jgi:hypothetical protein
MLQKTLIIVAASALVCGLSVQSASAKHRHHHRHHAMHVVAKKAEPMKATPGNNPFPIVASSETDRSRHPAPSALSGNNPMVIKK